MDHRLNWRAATVGLLALALAAGASSSLAHTAWLKPEAGQPGVFRLYFGGHQGRLESYRADKLKSVAALDAAGRPLALTRTGGDNAVMVQVKGQPALLHLHFDNGIHTRTGTGPSVAKPMNAVPGAKSATYAVKYGKTIIGWGAPVVTRPLGQPFEVIPVSADAPVAGRPMQVQVRIDGRPAAGVRIGRGEDSGGETTNAQGIASFTPVAGFNTIWAGKRIATTTEPRYTELSYEYALGFNAR
ncbi:MAG: DUF4198 domain-containing protein [Phenylobacterium sp.]|nr:DUF4198 domain-containing protein [Phenylobacterium sp.]